jgi:hypothetical protein
MADIAVNSVNGAVPLGCVAPLRNELLDEVEVGLCVDVI